MKRCLTSYVIRKMQIRTTARHRCTPIRIAKTQDPKNSRCWQGRGTTGALTPAGRTAEWSNHFGGQFDRSYKTKWASLVAQTVKRLPTMRPSFDPWVGKILWRRKWQPTPVLLPGKSYGWRSMVGYSPWGRRE